MTLTHQGLVPTAEPAKPGLLVPTILTPTAQLPLSEVIETTANDPVPAEVQGMPSFDNSGESDALLEDAQPRKEMPTTWLPHLMQAPAITTEAEPAAEPSTKSVVVVVPTVSTSDSISFS